MTIRRAEDGQNLILIMEPIKEVPKLSKRI